MTLGSGGDFNFKGGGGSLENEQARTFSQLMLAKLSMIVCLCYSAVTVCLVH